MSADPAELRQVIVEAITQVAPEADLASVRGDAYLGDWVELDSMDMLNIVAAIYERTGIDIPERDYGKLSTLDLFTAYLLDARSTHE